MLKEIPKDIKNISTLLDSKFSGPFGLKFGIDSLIGFIPVWGDFITLIISHYILLRSISMRVPASVLIQMILNTYTDFIIGSIPFFGDIFDVYFKSNTKNQKLLMKYLNSPNKTITRSRLKVILLVLILIFLVCIFFLLLVSLISSFM